MVRHAAPIRHGSCSKPVTSTVYLRRMPELCGTAQLETRKGYLTLLAEGEL